jgi:flagellar biosynthesis anti-sigma factor FlgM
MLKKKLKFGLFLSKVTLRGYITRSFGEHHEDQPAHRQFCSPEQQCSVSYRQEWSGCGCAGQICFRANGSTHGVAVTVSSLTRSMEAAGTFDAPDVDMTKVGAMREAIAKGSFAVNPEAIADKLLSNAQEILQRSRS